MANQYAEYSPTSMRVILGLLFLIPGIMKLMVLIQTGTHEMLVSMMGLNVGLVWLVAILELVCGLAVLLGYQLKYAVWPLIVIMLVAIFKAVIPMGGDMMLINLLFHLLAISGLVFIGHVDHGAYAIDK